MAVPAIQSATSSAPQVAPAPSPEPTSSRYALNPIDPWPYRGDDLALLGAGTLDTIEREYAPRRGASRVELTPLVGRIDEPSQKFELVFLAQVEVSGAAQYFWGISQTPNDAGPEFLWDEPLQEPAVSLAAALPGDEVARLLVVASPEGGGAAYGHDAASEFTSMTQVAEGVFVTPLGGNPATDAYRVLDPDGNQITTAPAPDPQDAPRPGPDGDVSAYGLRLDDPWPFRGVGNVGDLAAEDERLFQQTRTTRRSQEWSSRPLYGGSSDGGMTYLFMLHTAPGKNPVVTTTYQVDGEPARQSEQVVREAQQLIQAVVPTALEDGAVILVALASDQTGEIVLEQGGRPRRDASGDPGVGLWVMERSDLGTGRLLLYTQGDGREYHAEQMSPS